MSIYLLNNSKKNYIFNDNFGLLGKDFTSSFSGFVKRLKDFPIISDSAQHAIILLGQEDVDISSVEKVISMDPGLAVTIIKTANVGYSSKAPVSTIKQALIRIGATRAQGIIVTTSTLANLPENLRLSLAEHAMLSATLAKGIAKVIRYDKDVAYTMGLVHDIGLALFLIFLNKEGEPLVLPKGRIPEKSSFGMTHGETGAMYLAYAAFTSEVCNAIKSHHESLLDLPKPALIIRLADMLANLNGLTIETIAQQEEITSAGKYLGLCESDIQTIVKDSLAEMGA